LARHDLHELSVVFTHDKITLEQTLNRDLKGDVARLQPLVGFSPFGRLGMLDAHEQDMRRAKDLRL
jgi:hypothetical protein